MAKIVDRRMAAEMDGEFVVFLIGLAHQQAVEGPQVASGVSRNAANAQGTARRSRFRLSWSRNADACDRPVLALVRSLGGLCARHRPSPLAGVGRFQPAYQGQPRRCRDLARNLSHRSRQLRGHLQRYAAHRSWSGRPVGGRPREPRGGTAADAEPDREPRFVI